MFKCDQCDREFSTEEGFNQHNADKHGVERAVCLHCLIERVTEDQPGLKPALETGQRGQADKLRALR